MRNQDGFDLWADEYEASVGQTERENRYPFAGYREVLGRIRSIVLTKPRAAVLDLGFGTGMLTAELYRRGCRIWGQDFSERMIALARKKMPDACLIKGDFSEGLAPPLRDLKFDFITATYSLHHLTDEQKETFLPALRERLNEDGKLLIGDVAFRTEADRKKCRIEAGDEWDGEEYYFVAEVWKRIIPDMTFTPLSSCAGVFELPCRRPGKEEKPCMPI